MSTILDALRKVEEEKRTQAADVRTRLLTTPSSRFDFRSPRHSRTPWLISGGLVLVGAILGVTMMTLRTSSTPTEEVAIAPPTATPNTPQVVNGSPPQPGVSVQQSPTPAPSQPPTVNTKSAAVQITPTAPGVVLPREQHANAPASPIPQTPTTESGVPIVAEAAPQYDPWHAGNPQSMIVDNSTARPGEPPSRPAGGVQRSPFVNSSPSDRIVAPQPQSPSLSPRAPVTETKRSKPSPEPSRGKTSGPNATPARVVASPSSTNTEEPPSGASLSFLQWSPDPEKRVASIKIGTGPATIAHEGDSIDGMTVEKIRPDAVELRSGNSRYLLKAR